MLFFTMCSVNMSSDVVYTPAYHAANDLDTQTLPPWDLPLEQVTSLIVHLFIYLGHVYVMKVYNVLNRPFW